MIVVEPENCLFKAMMSIFIALLYFAPSCTTASMSIVSLKPVSYFVFIGPRYTWGPIYGPGFHAFVCHTMFEL